MYIYIEILEISQGLIWAIFYKNPSNSFYAITVESKKKQTCDGKTTNLRPTDR